MPCQQSVITTGCTVVPRERVHLDILGPFTTSESGNRHVFMILDQFTHWLELHALPEQTAEITAKTFFEQLITRYDTPLQVHTAQSGGILVVNCSPNYVN